MLLTLVTAAAVAFTQQTDTTFAVRPSARLDVSNFSGTLRIQAWAQNSVRVRADHSSRDRVEVSNTESVVGIKMSSRHHMALADLEISVPRTMAVKVSGFGLEISVEGTEADVSAETVEGDVTVRGGRGLIQAQSVEGTVTIEGARARVDAHSVDGDVLIRDIVGEVAVETVDGDITLERIESSLVEANTVDGEIRYDGTIKDGGRYRLATHDGDISVAVPEKTNATVTVATFSGEFESTFPVSFKEQRRSRSKFVLGTGSAVMELEAFDGTIQLRRPGERGRPDDHKREEP